MLIARSGVLYIRAGIRPVSTYIKDAGNLINFLSTYVKFEEIIAPYFNGARPFWRDVKVIPQLKSNSGALGEMIRNLPQSIQSNHPSNSFVGIGPKVGSALIRHNRLSSCFAPIGELADEHDFSMLLLGCVVESPGFSTVHVAQERLGLSRKHLLRLLLRWDYFENNSWHTVIAPESPGCSASFDKFYPYYESDRNLIRGEWHGVSWLFVPSARRALETEMQLLRERGRFVDCGRWNCPSCRLRLY
jgi:aminoglycoside N3'-acetyltransferase